MMRGTAETGGVLIGALLVGLLLAMLGGVAMNLAVTEATASSRQVDERTAQLLAESGVEQVVAWLTQGALPASREAPLPVRFTGTPDAPDVTYDAARPEDDRLLNDVGALAAFGRITHARLYGSGRPDGFCTVEVTAEARGGARRTVSVELGAWRIPPLLAAVQANVPPADLSLAESGMSPQVQVHWGDMVSNFPRGPWPYQTFKDHAQRLGSYYVPDHEGRLYRNGTMDPSHALTPLQVFGSQAVGDQRGLVFIDTLDQQPPNDANQATLVLDPLYMEGTFYINARVVLRPQGTGQTVHTLAPLPEGQAASASRAPVSFGEVTVNGVLYTAGALRIDKHVRVFGAVVAERGLTGLGLLEVWYNGDLSRGRVQGLPVVFPIRGTWREREH